MPVSPVHHRRHRQPPVYTICTYAIIFEHQRVRHPVVLRAKPALLITAPKYQPLTMKANFCGSPITDAHYRGAHYRGALNR